MDWMILKLCVQLTFLYYNKSLCQSHELFFVVFPEVPEPGKAPLLQYEQRNGLPVIFLDLGSTPRVRTMRLFLYRLPSNDLEFHGNGLEGGLI